METTSTKTVYVVLGYSNAGSGSLTFPEDFDFEGYYTEMSDAQSHCDRLNEKTLRDAGVDDIDDLECSGVTVYEVMNLKNLKG